MSAERILVVEDSRLTRTLIRAQLEDQGYAVLEAADGVEALDAARRDRPHVILLDVELPRLDGYGVLDAIRADPELRDTPVVFITGRTGAEDVAAGLRRGAHDYLRKPFEQSELLARVHVALRTRALQVELRDHNAQLERLARTDPLTNLANRRHLLEEGRRQLGRAERHGVQLCVLLADVDHFKAVNDRFGHECGDVVLVEVARRMTSRLRRDDVLGRWGGEEFLVFAPHTDARGATVLAEDVREMVRRTPVAVAHGSPEVTVSIGVAVREAADDLDALIARADRALYEAKAAGRDAVRVAAREPTD
jgi:diguanylate cyclase (GGDEF)-like protein